ncbi:MAG: alpha-galactosidase [Phycisphaeraceae bacterium]
MITDLFSNIVVAAAPDTLWQFTAPGLANPVKLTPPVFHIDGRSVPAALTDVHPVADAARQFGRVHEFAYEGTFTADADLSLRIVFRAAPDASIVRFKYELRSKRGRQLTKPDGRDALCYLGVDCSAMPDAMEVRFSEFNESVHSFCLSERPVKEADFRNEIALMGPMLTTGDREQTVLIAYEHGSQVPDAFLKFHLHADRSVTLAAVKGNYHHGRSFSDDAPFDTIWFQLGAAAGDSDRMASVYRRFVLDEMSPNLTSRKPYIFYNTWNFQERNKWWNNRRFLDSMNEQRMLDEIDVAHRMGIDVFVMDTGWYEKTGDWRVSRQRFPDGLKRIKAKLDGYGMKLGLWFDNAAALSSDILARHPECPVRMEGREPEQIGIWETEKSYRMCLASRYWEAFADELIRLVREVGVTYFKWDAIQQYGCDSGEHQHGSPDNSAAERLDCYAFEQGRAMIRVVDRLCAECPQAIVDFDITEGHRFVGLGFLAAGKYFLINNGPYYHNLNIPKPPPGNNNAFFFPGPARGWICRTPLTLDKWIASVLFLSHYFPDDPQPFQLISIGSLILGQNGIWGDLLNVSAEGVTLFGRWLGIYKQVAADITRSDPVCTGRVGGSPEIHEKIDADSHRGAVVIFACEAGGYDYVTSQPVDPRWIATDDVTVTLDAKGHAHIRATFTESSARFVFFGTSEA